MDIPRPTASTITDDQLDALWDALDQVEALHHLCGQPGPCTTLQIISRQRSKAMETTCPRSPAGRND